MPASLVIAQPQDQRKRLETSTETSTIYWIGNLTSPKQSLGATPHCGQQTAAVFTKGRGKREEVTSYRVNWGIDVRLAHQLPGKPEAGAGGKHIASY